MTPPSQENRIFGAQIVTVVGMFFVTLGILFIATLTYLDREDREFRNEVRDEFAAVRTEIRDEYNRPDHLNTRLGGVEGYLSVSGDE